MNFCEMWSKWRETDAERKRLEEATRDIESDLWLIPPLALAKEKIALGKGFYLTEEGVMAICKKLVELSERNR